MLPNSVLTLSLREQKLVKSLQLKKYREKEGLFVAEGHKVVSSLMRHLDPLLHIFLEGSISISTKPCYRVVSAEQMKKISALTTHSSEIAVFRIPKPTPCSQTKREVIVALDGIQDPGNLGTLIRLCDWLGIKEIILGAGTADPYAPKVVQATAGALANVILHTTEHLDLTLRELHADSIIGTSLTGTPISQFKPSVPLSNTVIIFGNEGHGLSQEVRALCTDLILLPPAETTVSDSLNVSVSAAIILSKLLS